LHADSDAHSFFKELTKLSDGGQSGFREHERDFDLPRIIERDFAGGYPGTHVTQGVRVQRPGDLFEKGETFVAIRGNRFRIKLKCKIQRR